MVVEVRVRVTSTPGVSMVHCSTSERGGPRTRTETRRTCYSMFGLDTVNRDANFFRIAVLLPSDQEENKQRPSTRPFFFFFFSDALLPFCWTHELLLLQTTERRKVIMTLYMSTNNNHRLFIAPFSMTDPSIGLWRYLRPADTKESDCRFEPFPALVMSASSH